MKFLFVLIFLVSTVLLVYLIHRNQVAIRMYFDSDLLGDYTPEYFEINNSPHRKNVRNGENLAKGKSLIVCGLLRDGNGRIEDLKEKINSLRAIFSKVRVLIVENDSKDDTRKSLLEWSDEDPELEVLGCDDVNVDKCDYSMHKTIDHEITKERMKKMAFLREIYRKRVANMYSDYDYVLVWDMDILGSLYIDGILSSLSILQGTDYDGLCANGLGTILGKSFYYDTFAHVPLSETSSSHDLKRHLKGIMSFKPPNKDGPVPVKSCFSGATLYKIKPFVMGKYATTDKTCEHTSFHLDKKMGVNPKMINYVLRND
jgi:hypothetical protein